MLCSSTSFVLFKDPAQHNSAYTGASISSLAVELVVVVVVVVVVEARLSFVLCSDWSRSLEGGWAQCWVAGLEWVWRWESCGRRYTGWRLGRAGGVTLALVAVC